MYFEFGEALVQYARKDVEGADFRLVMSGVGQQYAVGVGGIVVIFDVAGDVDVGTGIDSVGDEPGAGPAAESHPAHHQGGGVGAVAQCLDAERLLDAAQELERGSGLRFTDHTEAGAFAGSGGYQGTKVAEPEAVGHVVAHAVVGAVERRVPRIDGNAEAHGGGGYALHGSGAGEVFEAVEEQRMVRDDELAAAVQSLGHCLFRNVEAQQCGADVALGIPYLEAAVVVALLERERREGLYAVDDLL